MRKARKYFLSEIERVNSRDNIVQHNYLIIGPIA